MAKIKVAIQFIQPAPLNLVAGCTKKLLNDWSIKIQTRNLRTTHQVYALFGDGYRVGRSNEGC